jgi:hypothetical protein
MQTGPTPAASHSSWQELLVAPGASSHVVQLYDNETFLAAAASLFVAEGLARGEAAILNGTAGHVAAIRAALRSRDVDVDAALGRGQLSVVPIPAAIGEVIRGVASEAERFERASGGAVARAAGDERYRGLRWWGETANFLYQHGDEQGALAAEDLGNFAARAYGAQLLCSFLCDRFDPQAYHGILCEMCTRHTHLIPARDYVRHRLAVNRAIADVVGDIRGPLLQSLLSWKPLGCEVPSSQAVLFWLRDTLPERFPDVLARVKDFHEGDAA